MSDLRKDLLRQMKAIREKMDPKLVERVKLAALGKVPYDSDAAKEAVGHFLDAKRDGGAFRRKLEQALKAEGGTLDLDGEKAAPAKPAGKPRRGGRII
ncbi:cytochrome c biogenesis protein ResB [Azospirillum lipoferum]|uniref:Uncharacterized protein n=1 Tax=Azospirillum lipoferum TaxID=193 RepID=A0A5A9GD40_AZOLI|nr:MULTISPECIES: hypothetical protein [Azospirillum]KAA0591725.1 hypothetical protein FZ942_30565 [Azospirillum lipoferum]MCP1614886.1 cytochrome c biogenesis protein ResB [Azospirillum lipoferum]MDW5536363.1 hypothetical protein [Azospirillum sp. NL1]